MITGVTAQRITTASHQNVRILPTSSGMIIIDDQRIRGWSAADTGNLSALVVPSAAAPSYGAGSLPSGTTAAYSVVGNTGTWRSNPSNIVSQVCSAATGIKVSWSGIPNVSSYTVYRSVGAANRFTVTAVLKTLTATSYTDTGL